MKELSTRILVSIVGIPIVVTVVLLGKFYFVSLVILVSLLGLDEMYKMIERQGGQPHQLLGSVTLTLIMVLMYLGLSGAIIAAVIGLVVLSLIAEIIKLREQPISNVAGTLFGVIYVGLLFATLIGIRESTTFQDYTAQGYLVLAIFIGVWVCDTAAYFFGLRFGKYRLYEKVSPKKSVEGSVAGFLGVVLVFILAYTTQIIPNFTLQMVIILTVIIGLFGQIGDLAESWMKRSIHIKDSSAIIPGHGGVLDRFDSMLFVAPLTYMAIQFHLM